MTVSVVYRKKYDCEPLRDNVNGDKTGSCRGRFGIGSADPRDGMTSGAGHSSTIASSNQEK